jgi:hypothetical protein
MTIGPKGPRIGPMAVHLSYCGIEWSDRAEGSASVWQIGATRSAAMFDDAIALLAHLEATHEPGVHLYRGQTARRTHDWLDDDGLVRLESLYPSER